jgi:hypothetical protein
VSGAGEAAMRGRVERLERELEAARASLARALSLSGDRHESVGDEARCVCGCPLYAHHDFHGKPVPCCNAHADGSVCPAFRLARTELAYAREQRDFARAESKARGRLLARVRALLAKHPKCADPACRCPLCEAALAIDFGAEPDPEDDAAAVAGRSPEPPARERLACALERRALQVADEDGPRARRLSQRAAAVRRGEWSETG